MFDFRKSVATLNRGRKRRRACRARRRSRRRHSRSSCIRTSRSSIPIWTTAYIQRNLGYMVWDTLFAMDEKFEVKPQMVDKYDVSADKLTWTFTLRDGLEWSDGKPVTSEDCIASIKRWAAKDSMGQKMMGSVAGFEVVDPKTFKMKMKEPYGLVLQSLGKPVVQRALHDAQARRRDRSQHADQGRGRDRLRPVHLQGRRMEAGREDGLRQEPQVQAAQPSRPRAWPAARWSRSTGSNGSPCPTRRPRSPPCRTARST